MEKEKRLFECIDMLSHHISNGDRNEKYQKNLKEQKIDGSYPYIPFYFQRFTEILDLLTEKIKVYTSHPQFMDYGCGPGLTCHYTKQLGFLVHGIEYNKKLIPKYNGYIYEGDLEDEDTLFPLKDKFDVVYWYSPFNDPVKEILFEIRALNTVKIGGYVICPDPGFAYNCKKYTNNKTSQPKSIEKKILNQLLKNFEIPKTDKFYPILKRLK